ncbi:MAG: 4'-phosphopantetheinyl transferase superfamily protein [Actinomycetota bacterium]|nr:4'-phosphopantetheinyl transferase superfamily protein [Actinomycetota bacterium]
MVGSIAHGGEWAGAVVARDVDAIGLGFDIEPLEPPMTPGVEELVLTAAEKALLPDDHRLAVRAAKVAFTAKECVYKALFPSKGWRLGFGDVEIDVDLISGRWHAALDDRFSLGPGGAGLSGCFEVWDGHVFSAVLVPPEGARHH